MQLLVAVDFSDSTQKILEHVKELGKGVNAKIWLLHVAKLTFLLRAQLIYRTNFVERKNS